MKIFKIVTLSFVTIVLISLVIIVVTKYFQERDVNYQMSKLENGNTAQIIFAANFMGDHKIIESIPLLIKNIDDEERDFWEKEPKSGRINVSCVITYALNQITELDFEDTCYEQDLKEKDKDAIKQVWKDWYQNNYEDWLKEHTNGN